MIGPKEPRERKLLRRILDVLVKTQLLSSAATGADDGELPPPTIWRHRSCAMTCAAAPPRNEQPGTPLTTH